DAALARLWRGRPEPCERADAYRPLVWPGRSPCGEGEGRQASCTGGGTAFRDGTGGCPGGTEKPPAVAVGRCHPVSAGAVCFPLAHPPERPLPGRGGGTVQARPNRSERACVRNSRSALVPLVDACLWRIESQRYRSAARPVPCRGHSATGGTTSWVAAGLRTMWRAAGFRPPHAMGRATRVVRRVVAVALASCHGTW